MNLHQILEELAYDTGELPREAIEAAVLNKEEIIPYLIEILEEAIERINDVLEHDNYQGHLYSIYLLAQFREKRAFPLLLRLISMPGEITHAIFGDVITEDLSRIIASMALNDTDPILKLIENLVLSEYVRAAGISALVTLVGCGIVRRKVVIDYFRTLFNKLEKQPSFVWDTLIYCCLELYPEELLTEIVNAFEAHLVDTSFITLEHIQSVLQKPKEDQFFHLYQNAELIEDTVTEMEKWLTPL